MKGLKMQIFGLAVILVGLSPSSNDFRSTFACAVALIIVLIGMLIE